MAVRRKRKCTALTWIRSTPWPMNSYSSQVADGNSPERLWDGAMLPFRHWTELNVCGLQCGGPGTRRRRMYVQALAALTWEIFSTGSVLENF